MKSTNLESTPSALMTAIKLLASKGIHITQVAVSRELAQQMIDCREAIESPELTYGDLIELDTEFDVFLPLKHCNPKRLASKPDTLIGVMFGVDIILENLI